MDILGRMARTAALAGLTAMVAPPARAGSVTDGGTAIAEVAVSTRVTSRPRTGVRVHSDRTSNARARARTHLGGDEGSVVDHRDEPGPAPLRHGAVGPGAVIDQGANYGHLSTQRLTAGRRLSETSLALTHGERPLAPSPFTGE